MQTIWEFETKRVRVLLQIDDCCFPIDWIDDSNEYNATLHAIECGDLEYFDAVVTVFVDGIDVGGDSLGGCMYKSVHEFISSHRDKDPMNRNCSIMRAAKGDNAAIGHYFPGMVRNAISEARKNIAALSTGFRKAA